MKKTQHDRILECLRNPFNQGKDGWVKLPRILDLHISQYGTRIKELREGKTINKKKYNIENDNKWVIGIYGSGERYSCFRLVEGKPEQNTINKSMDQRTLFNMRRFI